MRNAQSRGMVLNPKPTTAYVHPEPASALDAFICITVGNSETQGVAAAVFSNQQQHCVWLDVKDTEPFLHL